jgi:anti-anti-sigma factor
MSDDRFGVGIVAGGPGRTARVSVAGDVDACTAPQLAGVLAQAFATAPLVEVNLGRLTFFSCAGPGVLRRAHRRSRQPITLVGIGRPVRRLLTRLDLASAFSADDREAAR